MELSFEPDTTVLVGRNGAGKTTVIDAVTVMLSAAASHTRSINSFGRAFRESDINNDERSLSVRLSVEHEGRTYRWTRGAGHPPLARESRPVEVKDLGVALVQQESERNTLPVLVAYPVNRAVLDVPLRIRKRHEFSPLKAWDDALESVSSNFRLFFEWFREREDLENQNLRRRGAGHDVQLTAVRNAIVRLLPGFEQPRVDRAPLRFMLSKDGHDVSVDQLSDGEKCLIGLTADLARRFAIANPDAVDPLTGDGVALIDEIDLHLHPAWQRNVLPRLRAFVSSTSRGPSPHGGPRIQAPRGRCSRANTRVFQETP